MPGDGFEPPTRGFSIQPKTEAKQHADVSKAPPTNREPIANVSIQENPISTGSDWKSVRSLLSQSLNDRLTKARDLQAAIDACDPALAAIIMDRALDSLRIGEPGTALIGAMDQARTWAEWATPDEVKAYTLACFEALSPAHRLGFLSYVTRNFSKDGNWRGAVA